MKQRNTKSQLQSYDFREIYSKDKMLQTTTYSNFSVDLSKLTSSGQGATGNSNNNNNNTKSRFMNRSQVFRGHRRSQNNSNLRTGVATSEPDLLEIQSKGDALVIGSDYDITKQIV